MDPATILGIAGTASQLANSAGRLAIALYSFVEAAIRIDKTLQSFAQEIQALELACKFVNNRLESIISQYGQGTGNDRALGRTDELWTCLRTQLDSCQSTITELAHLLGVDVPRQGELSIKAKLLKQTDLRLKQSEIQEQRDRVKTHTSGLHLTLSCIGIEISHLAPQRPGQDLLIEIQELKSQRADFADVLEQLRKQLKERDTAGDEALLRASGDVVSSSETLYESVHGSVHAPQPEEMVMVSDWIRDLHIIGSGGYDHASSAPAEGLSIVFTPYEEPISPPSTISNDHTSVVTEATAEDGYDSDDTEDDKVDMANASILGARRKFDQRKWSAAKAKFEDVLKQVIGLRIQQRRLCQIGEIPYLIAICTWHLSEPAVARQELDAVIQAGTRSGNTKEEFHGPRLCQLKSMLAQSCVRMNELVTAHEHVDDAKKSIRRSRLLGKEHESFYEAWALSARIFELQGNVTRSETILDEMIPQKHAQVKHLFDGLEIDSQYISVKPAIAPRDSVVEAQSPRGSFSTSVSVDSSPTLRQTRTMTVSSLGRDELISPLQSRNMTVTSFGKEIAVAPRQSRTMSLLSDTTLGTEPEASPKLEPVTDLTEPYIFQNTHLAALAAIAPARSRAKMTIAERQAALHGLKPETKVAKALVEGKDVAAKELVHPRAKSLFKLNTNKACDLHFAAMFGVTDVVETLLQHGADIEHVESNNSPLERAVRGGHLETVKLLLRRGARRSRDRRPSLLTLAATAGHYDVLDTLLTNGVDPTTTEHEAGSAVLWACAQNNTQLVDAYRLSHSASLSELRPVDCSLSKESFYAETAGFLVTQQPYVRCLVLTKIHLDAYGVAAQAGALDVLRNVADAGVNTQRMYVVDISGGQARYCAATLAAAYGHGGVIDWMMKSGNLHDSDAALEAAKVNKHREIVVAIKTWQRNRG